MCIGIPMKIKEIRGFTAICEAKGQEREVKLLFMLGEALQPGDYLVVERGNAIDRVTAEEAAAAWAIYDEMLAAADRQKGPVDH